MKRLQLGTAAAAGLVIGNLWVCLFVGSCAVLPFLKSLYLSAYINSKYHAKFCSSNFNVIVTLMI
jgi:hypothetical protein